MELPIIKQLQCIMGTWLYWYQTYVNKKTERLTDGQQAITLTTGLHCTSDNHLLSGSLLNVSVMLSVVVIKFMMFLNMPFKLYC